MQDDGDFDRDPPPVGGESPTYRQAPPIRRPEAEHSTEGSHGWVYGLVLLMTLAAGGYFYATDARRGPVVRRAPEQSTANKAPLSRTRLAATDLDGPGGPVHLPMDRRVVVHIWLQGCADCMPAFDALATLRRSGTFELTAPVVNVAYGEATLAWATAHGVEQRLVFDPGGSRVVGPLGISSFTTLVLDARGDVLLTDRPDRSGYAERVKQALGE